jgi:hypothetical protein
VRIPILSDTDSNLCRTAFRSCRTFSGAKRRTERVINRCPTEVKFSPWLLCPFGAPPGGDASHDNPGRCRAVYSGGR